MKSVKTSIKQSGATLIEVLISLLVFSIGIYGVAAFQLQAVKESFDSSQHTQAVWAAQEAIDRIRANETGYLNGNYATQFTNFSNSCPNSNPVDCISGTCTAAEMAQYDAYEIICDNPITNGALTLTCADAPCTNASDLTLTVSWSSKAVADSENDSGFDESVLETQTYTQVFRP